MRYQPAIKISASQLSALARGKRCGIALQRGQWLQLPDGRRARYVRNNRGFWIATGNGKPFSINIEFTELVKKARVLDPRANQISLF